MKLFGYTLTKTQDATRSIENPSIPLGSIDLDNAPWGNVGTSTATGAAVTPENALEAVSVFSAVSIIAGAMASLPLITFEAREDGKHRATDHPYYRLLKTAPNSEQSAFVFWELVCVWLSIYGNAFVELERNGRGDVIALWPILPSAVRVARKDGERFYIVNVNGRDVPLAAENVLHFQGLSLDGLLGLSPVYLGRETIGLATATEKFGASYFGNGAAASGFLEHPAKLGKDAAARLRESFESRHKGLSKAQRIAVLEEGMKFTASTITNEASQFLETRAFSVLDIARLLKIPAHLLQAEVGTSYASQEESNKQFATLTLAPLAKRIESELNARLFGDGPFYAEFVLEGMLRASHADRGEFYTKMAGIGALSINEIREREGFNHVANGDKHFVPLNMAALGATPNKDAA